MSPEQGPVTRNGPVARLGKHAIRLTMVSTSCLTEILKSWKSLSKSEASQRGLNQRLGRGMTVLAARVQRNRR